MATERNREIRERFRSTKQELDSLIRLVDSNLGTARRLESTGQERVVLKERLIAVRTELDRIAQQANVGLDDNTIHRHCCTLHYYKYPDQLPQEQRQALMASVEEPQVCGCVGCFGRLEADEFDDAPDTDLVDGGRIDQEVAAVEESEEADEIVPTAAEEASPQPRTSFWRRWFPSKVQVEESVNTIKPQESAEITPALDAVDAARPQEFIESSDPQDLRLMVDDEADFVFTDGFAPGCFSRSFTTSKNRGCLVAFTRNA